MQFKEFDCLVAMVYWLLYHALQMVSVRVNFGGRFYFHFSLVFHDFEGVLMKQLSTRNCWIWGDYSQLGATRLAVYLSSHIQRALVE